MNVGIIGYGAIAREHALALRRIEQAPDGRKHSIVGVMGRVLEPTRDFAEEFSAALATTELDELLAEPRVEAVIVCSPTDLHAAHTEQALRAGKHVLCEIPLATSLAETDRLIALADEVERRLMVCQTQRYFPPLIEAKRMITSGELHVHAIVSRYLFDRRNNVNWKGRDRSWTDNLLWHHTCHALDATIWLLGAGQVDAAARTASPDPATEIGRASCRERV